MLQFVFLLLYQFELKYSLRKIEQPVNAYKIFLTSVPTWQSHRLGFSTGIVDSNITTRPP